MNVAVARQHTSWSQNFHHLSTKRKLMDSTASPAENWTLAGRVRWCVETAKWGQSTVHRQGQEEMESVQPHKKKGKMMEVEKKVWKILQKNIQWKIGEKESWECFCNRAGAICLQDFSAWARKAHELVACGHAHTVHCVHPSANMSKSEELWVSEVCHFLALWKPFWGILSNKNVNSWSKESIHEEKDSGSRSTCWNYVQENNTKQYYQHSWLDWSALLD